MFFRLYQERGWIKKTKIWIFPEWSIPSPDIHPVSGEGMEYSRKIHINITVSRENFTVMRWMNVHSLWVILHLSTLHSSTAEYVGWMNVVLLRGQCITLSHTTFIHRIFIHRMYHRMYSTACTVDECSTYRRVCRVDECSITVCTTECRIRHSVVHTVILHSSTVHAVECIRWYIRCMYVRWMNVVWLRVIHCPLYTVHSFHRWIHPPYVPPNAFHQMYGGWM